jgi:acyl-CoA thioesterase FadM
MARVQLELPDQLPFRTEIQVRITDLNYGRHVGNDALLSMIHEARVRFLQHFGLTELDVGGVGLIMTDSVIVYRSEAFQGDVLHFAVGAADFNRYGCDFIFQVTNLESGREVARAKTGVVCYDYPSREVRPMPEALRELLECDAREVA